MAVIVKSNPLMPAALVKDGTYPAELTGIRQFANAYGERIGFEFTIKGGQFDGRKVMRSTTPQLSPQSKLAEVICGVMGRDLAMDELQGGIDIEALVGSPCQILVLQAKGKGGATYSNVEKVFRAS
jgi:hypothetical protein